MSRFRANFLILGAQKCGTTALFHYLAQHPQVMMAPDKEVHLFDDPALQGSDWSSASIQERYRSAFPGWGGQPAIGEATPIYLYLEAVPARVFRYNPEMRLIVLLREPGARAESQYHHEVRLGRETRSFPLALLLERWRLRRSRGDLSWASSVRAHSYVDRGRYARQLRRWLDLFPRSRLLVLRQEDLLADQPAVLRQVYAHLELPEPVALPPVALRNSFARAAPSPRWARALASWMLRSETADLGKLLGWSSSAAGAWPGPV